MSPTQAQDAASVAQASPSTTQVAVTATFFEPRKLDRIAPGTIVSEKDATGYSNLLLFVKGSLTAGDVDSVSSTVKFYGDLFNLVYLADVKKIDGLFELNKVAIGFASLINEENVIVTSDTAEELGLNLSWIGGSVLSGNEDSLNEIKVVAQNRAQIVIDAPSVMFVNGKHEKMIARYFIWVSRKTGYVGTTVWLLKNDGAKLSFASDEINLLPTPMVENRVMHVDGKQFNLFGIPTALAFAMVSLPKGTAYKVTDSLRQRGAESKFTTASLNELARSLLETMQ